MKYILFILISIGILVETIDPNPNDYDKILVRPPKQAKEQDLYLTINDIYDSMIIKCVKNTNFFGSVENQNYIIIYYEDRVKYGCPEPVFLFCYSINTVNPIITVTLYGLENHQEYGTITFDNFRYITPTITLINNQYAHGYKDLLFYINDQKNIYVELFSCSHAQLEFEQIIDSETKRQVYSSGYNFYDTPNATTANYSVQIGRKYDQEKPQYMIKFQQYSQDVVIPYSKIYAQETEINYYQDEDNLILTIPGINTQISYTSIYFYIILGQSEDEEFIKCYSTDHYSEKAQITYYQGTDIQNPTITVNNYNSSFNYAIAVAQILINGVNITKQLGTTYINQPIKKVKWILPILIILIGLSIIIFAVILYRIKHKSQVKTEQALMLPNPNPEPQQSLTEGFN